MFRSTIFSAVQGMVFVGLAIGPWVRLLKQSCSLLTPFKIGGYLFPANGYNDSFFIGSISLIGAILFYVVFICPESRMPEETAATEISDETPSFKSDPLSAMRAIAIKLLTALVLPISMFAPRRVPGTSRRNWNMTLCGLSIHLYIVSTVSASIMGVI